MLASVSLTLDPFNVMRQVWSLAGTAPKLYPEQTMKINTENK